METVDIESQKIEPGAERNQEKECTLPGVVEADEVLHGPLPSPDVAQLGGGDAGVEDMEEEVMSVDGEAVTGAVESQERRIVEENPTIIVTPPTNGVAEVGWTNHPVPFVNHVVAETQHHVPAAYNQVAWNYNHAPATFNQPAYNPHNHGPAAFNQTGYNPNSQVPVAFNNPAPVAFNNPAPVAFTNPAPVAFNQTAYPNNPAPVVYNQVPSSQDGGRNQVSHDHAGLVMNVADGMAAAEQGYAGIWVDNSCELRSTLYTQIRDLGNTVVDPTGAKSQAYPALVIQAAGDLHRANAATEADETPQGAYRRMQLGLARGMDDYRRQVEDRTVNHNCQRDELANVARVYVLYRHIANLIRQFTQNLHREPQIPRKRPKKTDHPKRNAHCQRIASQEFTVYKHVSELIRRYCPTVVKSQSF